MTELQPWEQRFRGKRWSDMPGDDSDAKKIHFALWRRGLQVIVDDGTAKKGIRLGGSLMGTLPSLIRHEPDKPKEPIPRPKRKPGPQGLPAHMQPRVALSEAIAMQQEVARVARNAGLSLSGAARLVGARRTAFAPSELARSVGKIMGQMKRFLEIIEEGSCPLP